MLSGQTAEAPGAVRDGCAGADDARPMKAGPAGGGRRGRVGRLALEHAEVRATEHTAAPSMTTRVTRPVMEADILSPLDRARTRAA